MVGRRNRGNKVEPIVVEAADSTSIEDQLHQNGDNIETVEPTNLAPAGRRGGRAKKDNIKKVVEKTIEEKPIKAATVTKKSGRGKKQQETNEEELNGEDEKEKEPPVIVNKRNKSKKELNENPIEKISETQTVTKRGRGKKAELVESPIVHKEEKIDDEIENKKKDSVSPIKKSGRKRAAAETQLVENGNDDEAEVIDTKKLKKETNSKELSTEQESSSVPSVKGGRGRKKKESIEKEEVPETKTATTGRGKKRSKIEETTNEAVEDINSEENTVEPATKKGKKLKAVKTTSTKTAPEKPIKIKSSKAEPKPKANKTVTDYNPKDFEFDKEYTLKISSWNVAGLRSWITKGGLKFIEHEKPDIICLQETKCSEDMIPDEAKIDGYLPYWYCKQGGYAGVAMYSKKMPINIENGIGDDEQDADGRIMTAEYEKFYLVNVYVPNAGRKLITLPKRLRWDNLFHEHITKLNKKKPVIICGDMNVSHQEIDLANPKTNKKNAGFTLEERNGMTKLLSLGFIDTFRHLYPDTISAYTFWTYMMNARSKNVGWRLDYFITSEKIINRIVDNIIRSQVMGSDHCPITLFLNI